MIVTLWFPGFFSLISSSGQHTVALMINSSQLAFFLFFPSFLVVTCSIYVIFSGPICLWTELAGSNAWLTRYIFWVQAVVIRPLKVDENEGNVRIGATQTPHCGQNYHFLSKNYEPFLLSKSVNVSMTSL